MKRTLMIIAALSLVTGCSAAGPLGVATGTSPARGPIAARVNTTTKAALVKVPANVFAYMEDHHARLLKQYDGPGESVHVAVHLVASRDHFKRDSHKATLSASEFADKGSARSFVIGMLNDDVAPGEYEYYLMMTATVVKEGKNRLSTDELEDFYVSDHGRNYNVTLK